MKRIGAASALLLFALACGKKAGGPVGTVQPPARKFPVEVETVAAREIRYQISAVGSLEASEIVSVTARVAGVVEKVAFREGEIATPERALVEIEPQRFRLALDQAKANRQQAEATAREAEAALAKREQLRAKDPGWVSAEEITTFRSRLDVAKAGVEQAKTAVELAELNLADAFVRSSSEGVIQERRVQPGQYVGAGTVLATLVRTDPLYLRFKVTEREAMQVRAGQRLSFTIRDRSAGEREATVTHVGAVAEEKTRMVECLARVTSSSRGLRPGYFAEVRMVTGSGGQRPVIPEGAIKPTERGFVVFVVEDDKALERVVEPGLRLEGGGVEIRSGLQAGEMLVTRGAQYLRSGASVEVKAP